VLCDTHDTSILIVDTYVTIPVSPRSQYTAVYCSSTKYRERAQVSRVSTIRCSSYHLATCTLQAYDAEANSKVAENHNYHSTTMNERAAVNKYNPISYFLYFIFTVSVLQGCGPVLRLGSDVVEPTDHALLLGVTLSLQTSLSTDTSPVPACVASTGYASSVGSGDHSTPSQQQRWFTLSCRRALTTATPCSPSLQKPPQTRLKLQRVLNAAARVVTETRKYDRGQTDILRSELHWLSVPQRVKYKLGTMMFRCLHHSVPRYLSDFCTQVANVAARSKLRSARRHLVIVPRYNRSTYGHRAFYVAGLSHRQTYSLRDTSLSIDSFRRQLKTFLFAN